MDVIPNICTCISVLVGLVSLLVAIRTLTRHEAELNRQHTSEYAQLAYTVRNIETSITDVKAELESIKTELCNVKIRAELAYQQVQGVPHEHI